MNTTSVFFSISEDSLFKRLNLDKIICPERYTLGAYSYIKYSGTVSPILENHVEVEGNVPIIKSICKSSLNLDLSNENIRKDNYLKANFVLKVILDSFMSKKYQMYRRKVVIYTDNKELAISYELDSDLGGLESIYSRDDEVDEKLSRFEDIKIIYISKESNRFCRDRLRDYTRAHPNKYIIELMSDRIKELEKEFENGLIKDLYELEYLIEELLALIFEIVERNEDNLQVRLLLSVKKNWLIELQNKIKGEI